MGTGRRAGEGKLTALIEDSADILAMLGPEGTFTYVNPAAQAVLGFPRASFIGTSPLEFVHRDDLPDASARLEVLLAQPGACPPVTSRFRHASGGWRWLEWRGTNSGTGPADVAFTARDVTERMDSALTLARTRRVLETVTAADAALVRARDRAVLMDEMCQIMVGTGGYALAWIAAPAGADARSVISVASHGDPDAVAALAEAEQAPPGPVTGGARAGRPRVVRDVGEIPAGAAVRRVLREFTYTALAALPIQVENEHIATLTVCSREPGAFGPDELRLLESLADDVGYGIGALRLREELDARVRRRTAELEEANQSLAGFASLVAHDLRAPLRALSGFSAALIEEYGERLGETGHGYAARIQAASHRMSDLIDALLNLSRIARAAMRIEQVDLSSEVAGIAEDIRKREPGRRVSFSVQGGVWVDADRALIRVVAGNLLENAWKFTVRRADARIGFGTAQTIDGGTCCYVRDNGAGFDPAYGGKLFRPFERLHTDKEFTGTGIGLASAQRIIQRHGGRIWAEGSPDAGATFYFTLAPDAIRCAEPAGSS